MTPAHVIQAQEPKDTIDQWMAHYLSWSKLKCAVAWFLKLKDLVKELAAKRKGTNTLSGEVRMVRISSRKLSKEQTKIQRGLGDANIKGTSKGEAK